MCLSGFPVTHDCMAGINNIDLYWPRRRLKYSLSDPKPNISMPCNGTLLLIPSSNKTSIVYPLQPLDVNGLFFSNSFFFVPFLVTFQKFCFTLRQKPDDWSWLGYNVLPHTPQSGCPWRRLVMQRMEAHVAHRSSHLAQSDLRLGHFGPDGPKALCYFPND